MSSSGRRIEEPPRHKAAGCSEPPGQDEAATTAALVVRVRAGCAGG